MFSSIDLSPLAPVFFLIALSAISFKALSLKVNLAPSSLKSSWYCLIKEFLGSFRIFTRDPFIGYGAPCKVRFLPTLSLL